MAIEPNWMQNRDYSARLDRQIIASLFYEGVRTPGAYAVSERGAGANMSVDVAVGEAFVDGDDQPNQGTYFVESDAVVNIAIGAAPGSNSRIDLVVLQVRDPNAGGPAGDDAVIQVVAGTVAASPVAPAVPDSALVLAQVTVASGTASITTAMISNRRVIAGRKAAAGTLELYSGPVSLVPNGWLVCDGAAEVRADRPNLSALYALGGYPYGAGNGTTTFNKPDLRERVPLAAGATLTTIGATGGAATSTLTTANMPAHSHTVNSHTHTLSSHTHEHVHTHSMQSHTHSMAHTHEGQTTPDGSHVHQISTDASVFFYDNNDAGNNIAGGAVTILWRQASGMNTGSSGTHIHLLQIGQPSSGSTGGPSTSSTGGASDATTGGPSNNTSGATSPGTSSVGSGSAFATRDPYQVVTAWLVCVG